MISFDKLRSLTFSAMAAFAALAWGAAPAGYYSSCQNKGGKELLTALYSTITSHTTVSYADLLNLYKTSDVYPEDGKIWDMYSTKHWTIGTTCGSYKNVGDCYNREHSFPKSWFNDATPMYSDAFHLYPTDGKVNGQRSNYPYGECTSGTNLGTYNGVKALGRLGKSTFSGYTGTVFEPDDEYKGDFARSYFYMAACYNDRIAGWSSDMLARNNYPVFSSWAINLLLKWHRQDPVSKKEIDRNEVVYGRQRNRNPFIDHPELAEYIWGDKTAEKWTEGATTEVAVNQPVNGSTVDFDVTAVGSIIERSVKVLTSGATSTVSLAVSNAMFVVSPTSLTSSTANTGIEVKVRYRPTAAGSHTATLTVTAGTAKSVVNLTGSAINGLPLGQARDVTESSFTAVWTYVYDDDIDGNYFLSVSDAEGLLPGYPRNVDAMAGQYTVTGLEPDTEYSFSIASESMKSEVRTVRTAAVIPSVDFLFDGDLYFAAIPGEPSDVAELLVATDYIDSDFTVTVKAPFEISTDHTDWSTSLTMSPDESRLYMRLNSEHAGTFETVIRAEWQGYVFDDAVAEGVVSDQTSFIEDFEVPYQGSDASSYTNKTYNGTACTWSLQDAIVGTTSQDPAHSGDQCIRFGKNASGLAQMEADRDRGIGDVSFFARVFSSDPASQIAVEYSTDGGATWTEAGKVTVSEQTYRECKVRVGASGKVRLRLRQLSGKRWLLDDVSLTDNSTGVDDPAAERHSWDAYSHGGKLFVNVEAAEGLDVAVYAIDGITLHSGRLDEGLHTFGNLAPGSIYIVVVGDFARTVLVR